MPARALPPSNRSSACASTVLPAPVSPVSTFRPGPRHSSARSISSRFSTRSSWSTHWGLPAGPDGSGAIPRSCADLSQLRRELWHLAGEPAEALAQAVVEGRAGDLRERAVALAEL